MINWQRSECYSGEELDPNYSSFIFRMDFRMAEKGFLCDLDKDIITDTNILI